MLGNVTLQYFGWSSFALKTTKGTLLFDPVYRKLYGAKWANLQDFQNIHVICVTHGHFDHYIDSPNILKQTEALLVSSNEVCKHLRSRYRIKQDRLLPIKPFQEFEVSEFKITAFEWRHRKVNFFWLLKTDPITSFQFIWLNFFNSPLNTPYFGFYVEGPDNIRLMNYCEGFSNAMNIKEVQELGQQFKPEILLAGMQLNFEEQLATGVAALSPKIAILFHPHTALFDKAGLNSTSPQRFAECVKSASPKVEVIIAKPQSEIKLSSLNLLS